MRPSKPRPQRLEVLVLDDQPFRRRLIAETLPCLGSMRIDQVASTKTALEQLNARPPHLLITDWGLENGQGARFVKDIRCGNAGDQAKRMPVLMTGENLTAADLELARNCGVTEFLLRPFSVASLTQRFFAALEAQRDFITSAVYVGPCRRRDRPQIYRGPRRRLLDEDGETADPPIVKIQKDQMRALLKRVNAALKPSPTPDRKTMREIFLAARDIDQLATDMDDPLLLSAADSLFSYVQGVGATPRLTPKVIDAHLDALTQLVDLPNSQVDLRTTVTRELAKLVEKKLRGGIAA